MTATFELPGLTKDNVQIDIQNGSLSISGETTVSTEQQEHGFAVKERKSGKFVRSIKLPDGTQVSSVLLFFPSEDFQAGAVSDGFPPACFVAQGRQGLDGERRFDRYLSQVFSWPGHPAHQHRVNEVKKVWKLTVESVPLGFETRVLTLVHLVHQNLYELNCARMTSLAEA